MNHSLTLAAVMLLATPTMLQAEDQPSTTPKVVPATRPEMKAVLEALKERTPRLPLAPSEEGGGVGNGRMRQQYLPPSWGAGGRGAGQRQRGGAQAGARQGGAAAAGRNTNGASTFDSVFTTAMFWIVSRGNNCHYCLGHQELKLRADGVEDDRIAALDSDWSAFEPRMQAALAYTRKLTLEPQLVGDADIAALKKHFTDAEIIELTRTVAGFNATNRWTDGLGIPQDRSFSNRESNLLTPTSEKFRITASIASPNARKDRPALPTPDEFAAAVAAARTRKVRVELPSEADSRQTLADVIGDRIPLMWERAMSAGGNTSQVKTWNTVMTDDNLPPRLKAELAFICAIHNRAWYAAAHAAHRLTELGASPADLTSLYAGDARGPASATAATATAHALAAKSTASPHLVTDADIAKVRKHYSDAETAMIVQVICLSNQFDRVTEALGLPLEDGVAVKAIATP